jgi:enoyl-CoA hydratase
VLRYSRPQSLNPLNVAVRREMAEHLNALAEDDGVRVVVLAGTEKAFAAGADLVEMSKADAVEMHGWNTAKSWKAIGAFPKPLIAAVSGFALGGGCELAMHCDIIIAGQSARFGQPEVKVGIMPGAGGTQRLTRAVGKAKAMDLCLTGRMMDAAEAERCGLVARVVPAASLMDEAMKVADTIASMSLPALMVAKEAVNSAFEMTLAEGIRFERRTFQALFATSDQKEGMAAFVEKRPPKFQNR